MDMKKILQVIDGAVKRPVEGSEAMKRFVSIVAENNVAETAKLSAQEKLLRGLKRGGYDAEERQKYWKEKSAELKRQRDEYEKDLENKKQGVAEGEKKSMSRAAKGNEKYGKDGMKALAKAGREGASEKELDKIRDKHDKYSEGLNFKDYLNLVEAKKKITASEDPCWKGYKMVGTKKKGGREVPNCVPGKKGD